MTVFAGYYGPESITNAEGDALIGKSVPVYVAGTDTPATLYDGFTKDTEVANPTATDSRGNLAFFADPGRYEYELNGVRNLCVLGVDPSEPGGAGGGISRYIELADVNMVGLVDGNVPTWDAESAKWEPGSAAAGPAGVPGVSVTNAAINGTGRLILTLSSGATVDAGVARGTDGLPGTPGTPGSPGVSITGATINGAGHLILSLSTGATVDTGTAKGADGLPGSPGTNGVGITTAVVNGSGHLILTLSDASTIDAGAVGTGGGGAGTPGVSVTDGTVNGAGHLILTLSSGATIDAGVVVGPAGSPGGTGSPGTNGVSVTGASIDGSGHLILTLSSGATVDAGVAKGAKGDTGDAGTAGSNGISVTGAVVNGSGHLVLTLSSGGTIDAGVAKGADGVTGPQGPPGVGTQGIQGIQGPPGYSNAVYTETWSWTTSTTAASTSGQVGINTGAWATATALNLNEKTSGNRDMVAWFAKFKIGDEFQVQQKTDATRWAKYRITATPTDNGTYWSFPVVFEEGGTVLPSGAQDTMVSLLTYGPQVEEWLSGSGAPAAGTGQVGDWYLNLTNGDVYEKTASTTWTLQTNIKGADATVSASTKGFVHHGATAGTARPSGYGSVEWIGTVQPTNMALYDTWINA